MSADDTREGALATLRSGLRLSPELTQGLGVTFLLAVLAAAGKVAVPLVVQQAVDAATGAQGGLDLRTVVTLAIAGALALAGGALCSVAVGRRLSRASEAGLRTLRVRAFRHVHDLTVLVRDSERRGSLVSRVTSDVDTISQFVQWGGIMLLVSVLQIIAATALMLVYSWELTIAVYLCFIPVVLASKPAQRIVSARYAAVREQVGALLGAISESVVGVETIRAYGVSDRVQRRVEASVEATRDAMVKAQTAVSVVFAGGVLTANLVIAVVAVVGLWLGVAGRVTVGEVVGMIFLAQMFAGPVQLSTEILNELQNALAGWRRVLDVLGRPVDVPDPGAAGRPSPSRPAHLELRGIGYSYPGGPPVLSDVDVVVEPGRKVAVVGATGSGKTTMARLVCRLVDPTEGAVLLDGTDLRELRLADLRHRVVLVPQEGFLFDASLIDNVAYGWRPAEGPDGGAGAPARSGGGLPDGAATLVATPEARAAAIAALDELGLGDWWAALPDGLETAVGQRGENLSAGERQLVSLARAHLAGGDLLVLDEATSAVDPATEVRLARALDELTRGRTTMTIAHRLSTAEAADLVVVVERGRVLETGTHHELAARGGAYARLHAAWVSQTR